GSGRRGADEVAAPTPAVGEVAVLGLPDAEWGEAVIAFVVLRPGMSSTEQDLVEHCRRNLASYKKPRAVRFVASLPRSHYGKVLRAELLAQLNTYIYVCTAFSRCLVSHRSR